MADYPQPWATTHLLQRRTPDGGHGELVGTVEDWPGCWLLLVMTCCRIRHDAACALRPQLHLDKRPTGEWAMSSVSWVPGPGGGITGAGAPGAYVTQRADFGATHGSLAGVIALLPWTT